MVQNNHDDVEVQIAKLGDADDIEAVYSEIDEGRYTAYNFDPVLDAVEPAKTWKFGNLDGQGAYHISVYRIGDRYLIRRNVLEEISNEVCDEVPSQKIEEEMLEVKAIHEDEGVEFDVEHIGTLKPHELYSASSIRDAYLGDSDYDDI